MNVTTTLDRNYSDPAASPASWSETSAALEAAQMFWVTTVRPDGRPHVTPLVAVWLDDVLYFATGPDERKSANLRANPEVALTTGTDQWDGGLDVVLEGTASRVTECALLERLATAWTRKWDGRWTYQAVDGGFAHSGGAAHQADVYAVRPAKIWAHRKGDPFSATRHVIE